MRAIFMMVTMILPMPVVSTCHRRVSFVECTRLVASNGFFYGRLDGKKDSNPARLQLHHRPHPDATNSDSGDVMPCQGSQGLTTAMLMMKVLVLDGLARASVRVHNQKKRSRPEVAANGTLQSEIFSHRNAKVHVDFSKASVSGETFDEAELVSFAASGAIVPTRPGHRQ
jgi:hypothetical protein